MVENTESKPKLVLRVRQAVFHTRSETNRERYTELDSLYNQLKDETVGSQRYNNIFHAYRWLKRQPDRLRPVILGKEIPVWF